MALSMLYNNRTRSTQPGMGNQPVASTNAGVSMAGPAPMNNDPVASTNAGVSMGGATPNMYDPNDPYARNRAPSGGNPAGAGGGMGNPSNGFQSPSWADPSLGSYDEYLNWLYTDSGKSWIDSLGGHEAYWQWMNDSPDYLNWAEQNIPGWGQYIDSIELPYPDLPGGDMWIGGGDPAAQTGGGQPPQYGYAPGQQWMPQPGNYAPNPYFAGWAGEGMGGGESSYRSGPSGYSTPGVSPYNVSVGQVDYDALNSNFINPAFDQMMSRLNPQFDQQRQRFDQNMINRGIPVGSEAYNAALQQMDWNINDATQSAAVGAMGFGLGAQDQMFQQGLGESSLANALARAQMADATQRFGLGMDYDMGMRRLGEMGRQYDYDYGLRSDALDWSQMMDLEDLTFRDYTTELGNQRYSDNLALSLMGGIPGFTPNPSGLNMGALGYAADNPYERNQAWNSWLTDMGNFWGNFDWGDLFNSGNSGGGMGSAL